MTQGDEAAWAAPGARPPSAGVYTRARISTLLVSRSKEFDRKLARISEYSYVEVLPYTFDPNRWTSVFR